MEDEQYKHLFKFVCLFNPTFDTVNEGETYLENLHSKGFKGSSSFLTRLIYCVALFIIVLRLSASWKFI